LRLNGYDVHISAQLERGLNLDRCNPSGVHIGRNTIIASRVTILSHHVIPCRQGDHLEYGGEKVHTYVGSNCLIGVGAYILAGVKIGDNVVVGAGSVVTRDIPSNTISAGNPARILRSDVDLHDMRL
jgi:acetyltransferase-like isoleucine patch superfamily enzyme